MAKIAKIIKEHLFGKSMPPPYRQDIRDPMVIAAGMIH